MVLYCPGWPEICHIAEDDPKLMILLPLPPRRRDYRHASPSLVSCMHFCGHHSLSTTQICLLSTSSGISSSMFSVGLPTGTQKRGASGEGCRSCHCRRFQKIHPPPLLLPKSFDLSKVLWILFMFVCMYMWCVCVGSWVWAHFIACLWGQKTDFRIQFSLSLVPGIELRISGLHNKHL